MINRIHLPGTDISTSVLGAGCASLGSRYGRSAGLRALSNALDAGITWFDVAPAYGAGNAEVLLGEFIQSCRQSTTICSKVGLVPPRRNTALKHLYTVGRPFTRMATGLRKAFRNARGTRNVAVNLSPGFIRASVETSLKRLRTDYLDVLALHNVSLEDLAHPVIQETLSELVSSGKVRYLATAGSSEAALAALSYPGLYSIVQLADNPAAQPLRAIRLASSSPIGIVTHSVFGLGGQREFFTKVIEKTPHLRATLQAAGYGGAAGKIASDLLLDRALASNAEGVVLMSMFAREHLDSNVARASRPVNPEAISLAELVTGATEPLDLK